MVITCEREELFSATPNRNFLKWSGRLLHLQQYSLKDIDQQMQPGGYHQCGDMFWYQQEVHNGMKQAAGIYDVKKWLCSTYQLK